MPNDDLPAGFQPSVLDRLTDADSAGTSDRRGYSEQAFISSVRRDLEELLNTRRPTFGELGIDSLPQVQKSVVGFGLPDFANLRGLTEQMRQSIGREIAEAIANFEPRLTDIEVTIKDSEILKNELKEKFLPMAVYFHIAARLRMDPCPPVAFETVLELAQGRHRVEGSESHEE